MTRKVRIILQVQDVRFTLYFFSPRDEMFFGNQFLRDMQPNAISIKKKKTQTPSLEDRNINEEH